MNQNQSASSEGGVRISLVNFPYLPLDALRIIEKEYQLKMGVAGLRVCQSHYRSLGRDPEAEELMLLDSMVYDGYYKAEAYLLSDMETESEMIADTFADLLTRRDPARRTGGAPLSLLELASMMEGWLAANDPRANATSGAAVRFSAYRDLLLTADGYQRTASSGNTEEDISIGVRPVSAELGKKKPCGGDYVLAILSDENESGTFLNTLAAFLTSSEVQNTAKLIKVAEHRCLLPLLVELGLGMSIETDRSDDQGASSRAALTTPVSGALLVATPTLSADMLLLAQAYGLRVRLVAKIKSSDTLSIKLGEKRFSYSASFLSSLVTPLLYSAKVDVPKENEASVTLSRIGTCTLRDKRSAVVKVDAAGSSPFHAALLGTIYATCHCVASGIPVTDVSLSTALSLSPVNIGEDLSAILGLYRAQAELALRGNAPVVKMDARSHPTLCAVALAPLPETTVSPFAVGGGTQIYYLEPHYTEDGIPDFADFKKLLGYLEHLIADKKALSVRATGNDLLEDLTAMSRDTVVSYLFAEPVPSRIGGFLVETTDAIQGLLIGKTEKSEATLDI